MPRKVDFYFELVGSGTPMEPINWDACRRDQEADQPALPGKFEGWARACVARKESRTLYTIGSYFNNADITNTCTTLLRGMTDQVAKLNEGSRAWSHIGVVVLYGSSIAATTALAFAALLDENAVTVNYLCLSDLPLFQDGIKPPVDRVGALATTPPDLGKGAGSARNPFSWHLDWASNTQPDSGDEPRTTLDCALPRVRVKDNRYQTLGNRLEGSISHNTWRWSSAMKGKEIHGRISNDGWNNLCDNNFSIDDKQRWFGNKDDEFHIAFNQKTISDWNIRGLAELAKL